MRNKGSPKADVPRPKVRGIQNRSRKFTGYRGQAAVRRHFKIVRDKEESDT